MTDRFLNPFTLQTYATEQECKRQEDELRAMAFFGSLIGTIIVEAIRGQAKEPRRGKRKRR